jgi:hypothetical protein
MRSLNSAGAIPKANWRPLSSRKNYASFAGALLALAKSRRYFFYKFWMQNPSIIGVGLAFSWAYTHPCTRRLQHWGTRDRTRRFGRCQGVNWKPGWTLEWHGVFNRHWWRAKYEGMSTMKMINSGSEIRIFAWACWEEPLGVQREKSNPPK